MRQCRGPGGSAPGFAIGFRRETQAKDGIVVSESLMGIARPSSQRHTPRMNTVLIPGFMADASLWDDMASALGALGPLIHGDVSRAKTMAETARHVLAEAPEQFALLGFSMGGYIAREIARAAPERVQALVLVATQPWPVLGMYVREHHIDGKPDVHIFRGVTEGVGEPLIDGEVVAILTILAGAFYAHERSRPVMTQEERFANSYANAILR